MNRLKGISMIIGGATLWGTTGPMMEWLSTEAEMSAPFMLSVRLIIAGILMLAMQKMSRQAIMRPWKSKNWSLQLVIFSMIGLFGLQYSFVKTIEVSNAIVATLLQFLSPIFVIIFISITYKKWPPLAQVVGVIGTLFGLFLLLTNGSVQSLMVSKEALVWGIVLGLTYAFYTLYPIRLMNEFGVLTIVAWATLLSGVYAAIGSRVWTSDEWHLLLDPQVFLMMVGLIVLGSAAYVLFLGSMTYITAVETSVLSSFEPLAATVISIIWLNANLLTWQIVGMILMLIFVVYLSLGGKKTSETS